MKESPTVINGRLLALDCASYREHRIKVLWIRFTQLAKESSVRHPRPWTQHGKVAVMAEMTSLGKIPGWYFQNSLELTDLAGKWYASQEYTPRPNTQPVPAVPGSKAKVRALAKRVANGVELFHELDGVRYESND